MKKSRRVGTLVATVLALLAIFMNTQLAFGQVANPDDNFDPETDTEPGFVLSQEDIPAVPMLYVNSINLNTTDANPGSVVSGNFTVHNPNGVDINNAQYIVSFVSEYVEETPYVILDSAEAMDLPFLPANSMKTVSFNYKIPENAYGSNPGINIVSVLDTGTRRGWGDVRLNFQNPEGNTVLFVKSASVVVAGEEFELQNGPTVYPGDVASFDVSMENQFANTELTPKVTVTDFFADEVVYEERLSSISVSLGELTDYSWPLKVDDLEPGVYVARLEMLDSQGINRVPQLDFRYIVGGGIGNIHHLYANQQSVSEGEVLDVFATISGIPDDLLNNERSSSIENVTLEVEVIDAKTDEVIGVASVDVATLKDQTLTVGVPISKNATEIKLKASLSDATGAVLSNYEAEIPEEEKDSFEQWVNWLIGLVGILIVIIASLAVMAYVKNKGNKKDPTVISAMILIFALFVSGFILTTGPDNTQAATTATNQGTYFMHYAGYNSSPAPGVIPTPTSIVVNSPMPPSVKVYRPGEAFNFSMNFNALTCSNSSQIVNVYGVPISSWSNYQQVLSDNNYSPWIGGLDGLNLTNWQINGTRLYTSGAAVIHGDHTSTNNSYGFTKTGYVAPSTPGTYKLYFYVRNSVPVGGWINFQGQFYTGYVMGYTEIRVEEAEDQCLNLEGIQETVPDGYYRSDDGNCYQDPGNEDMSVLCTVSNASPEVNELVTFTAVAENGYQPYNYAWGGDVSGSDPHIFTTFSDPGTYNANITVTDDGGESVMVSCPAVVVTSENDLCSNLPGVQTEIPDGYVAEGTYCYIPACVDGADNDGDGEIDCDDPDCPCDGSGGNSCVVAGCNDEGGPTVSCTPEESTVSLGEPVTINANIYGNNSAYNPVTSYEWIGDEGITGDQSSVTHIYSVGGPKIINVEASFTNGQVVIGQCALNVVGGGETAVVDFEVRPTIADQDNHCPAYWTVQNAVSCQVLDGNTETEISSGEIMGTPIDGEGVVTGGAEYYMSCVGTDGLTVLSDAYRCLSQDLIEE